MHTVKPGLYLLHKPVGATSFSLVQAFGREVDQALGPNHRRFPLCHGGTLDPFAHGLLLMLAGQTTRVMDLLHAAPKTYVAQVAWGAETDNGDLHGKVVAEGDAGHLTPEALEAALQPFLGWTEQVPPATSAKKIGGEPAYKKAHRGEHVELPPSRVYLHSARWLSHELPRTSRLELVCRGGYYVRALARDLGRALGCGAHLTALHRTRIGPWEDPGPEGRTWVHGRGLLPWLPWRELSDFEVGELRQGRPVPDKHLQPPDWHVPRGYPLESPHVRGFHLGKLAFALERRDGGLSSLTELRGGL